jgi:hypothetical protein
LFLLSQQVYGYAIMQILFWLQDDSNKEVEGCELHKERIEELLQESVKRESGIGKLFV